jgi:hypothetical protein
MAGREGAGPTRCCDSHRVVSAELAVATGTGVGSAPRSGPTGTSIHGTTTVGTLACSAMNGVV